MATQMFQLTKLLLLFLSLSSINSFLITTENEEIPMYQVSRDIVDTEIKIGVLLPFQDSTWAAETLQWLLAFNIALEDLLAIDSNFFLGNNVTLITADSEADAGIGIVKALQLVMIQ
jgi:hypothetical protein